MPHIVNLLIVLGIVTVFILLPYLYQMMKWYYKDPKRWATFKFDRHVKPEDLRFSALTSNLIIGNQEMPHPVFRDLPHIDSSFQKWVTRIPFDKDAKQAWHGNADTVSVPSIGRKIFTASVYVFYLAGLILLPMCVNGAIPFLANKAIIAILTVITFGGFLFHAHYYNAWSASDHGLIVGRWFFKVLISWSDISFFKLQFPKASRSALRRSTFMIHLRYKGQTFEICSRRFMSIFLLYCAITAFRSDLKISGDVRLSNHPSLSATAAGS